MRPLNYYYFFKLLNLKLGYKFDVLQEKAKFKCFGMHADGKRY